MHEGVVDLDPFLSLPTDSCCQPTVANRQPICCYILENRPEAYHHHCELKLISHQQYFTRQIANAVIEYSALSHLPEQGTLTEEEGSVRLTSSLRSAAFHAENIHFSTTTYLYEKVNCTDPSLSINEIVPKLVFKSICDFCSKAVRLNEGGQT
jgi:hypothetical protein